MTRTIEFCTILDTAFVPRWLALHRSMTHHSSDIRFLVCCWDARTRVLIDGLSLPNVTTLQMEELEAYDPELAEVRGERTFRAHRSGAKASLIRQIFHNDPDVDVVVYLDADLMFFDDPMSLVDELGEGSILLVPHRYPRELEHREEAFGRYQAGSIAFRRGPEADGALAWWRERCLEWCSFKPERGRWADQRYLQDWPERFSGVVVTEHIGIGLAPWNSSSYRIHQHKGLVMVDDRPLVFFHYSNLRLSSGDARRLRLLSRATRVRLSPGPITIGWAYAYDPAPEERTLVLEPYVREVGKAVETIRRDDPAFTGGLFAPGALFMDLLRNRIGSAARRVLGR